MAKLASLSNGEMYVGLDYNGLVHDFYYPYVGQENLTTSRSKPHMIGVMINDKFDWLNSPNWDIEVKTEFKAAISSVVGTNKRLGAELKTTDAVDSQSNSFIRQIELTNTKDKQVTAKLYLHQVFQISQNGRGDTAFYEPDGNYIFDYKGHTALIIYAENQGQPFSQFAVGNYQIEGKHGTYIDAEDGHLSGNLVEHGGVDSVIGFEVVLEPNQTAVFDYWIAAGSDQADANRNHMNLKTDGLKKRLEAIRVSHRQWLETAERNLKGVEDDVRQEIFQSLLIIRSHIDKRGSILASADSSIYNYGRDYYGYCWPRDGAYAVWPLIRLGYSQEATNFFDFCVKVLHENGYLQHKFQPDGSYGSTWHPLMQEHHKELAIQEDETAIVLYMIAEYVEISGDEEYFKKVYDDFIKPATDFIAYYIDFSTGLPHPSYDLWEQKFLTTTYTTFLVTNTLRRMAKLTNKIVKDKHAAKWVASAEAIDGSASQLFDKDLQHFVKGLYRRENGELDIDKTLDVSSAYGVFRFGGQLKDSFALAQTIKAIEDQLISATPGGGVVRYLDDGYLRKNPSLPGNPWFVCSFWMVQYYLHANETEKAQELLQWCREHQIGSNIMSEQIDPDTGFPTGVTPLVWSHAEHINTLLDIYS